MWHPKLPPAWQAHRKAAIVTAIVLAVAAGGAWYAWRALATPVYAVTRGDIVQSIVASGRVETPRRVELGSQVTGKVVAVPVAEGQAVAAGQLLIELDHSEARAAVEQARAAVAQADARLTQISATSLPLARQTLRQAEVTLQNVQRQYQRSRDLHARGFIGQAALDDAQRNLDIATSQVQAARVQVESNGSHGSEFQVAQAALAQSTAALRMAQARLDLTSIAAPLAGTLIARAVELGDVVQAGKTLMTLSPAGQTQLVLQIDEKNLGALRIGQRALASADAYAEQRFDAVLVYINPAVDPQRGSVEIKLDVPSAPTYLRQDMTVSVDIEVARRPQALTAPIIAVHDSAGPAPWVMKVAAGRAGRQPIRIGLRGAGTVEVLDGLAEGDRVLAATAPVRAGQPVRAVLAEARRQTRP